MSDEKIVLDWKEEAIDVAFTMHSEDVLLENIVLNATEKCGHDIIVQLIESNNDQ
jgi:hypothetical protein